MNYDITKGRAAKGTILIDFLLLLSSPSTCGWVYKFHAWPGTRLISSHRPLPAFWLISSHLIFAVHYHWPVVDYPLLTCSSSHLQNHHHHRHSSFSEGRKILSSWRIIRQPNSIQIPVLSNSFASRSSSTVSLSPSSPADVQLILFWLIAHVTLWDDCPFHGQAALIIASCLIDGLPLFFGSPRSTCIAYLGHWTI